MPSTFTILIASTATAERSLLLEWLSPPGYSPVSVASFGEAKQHLAATCPDLLVTNVKLGEYNGLHLVVRGHLLNPRMRVIILGHPDSVLQRDAEREGAVYLANPFTREQFLDCVARVLRTRPSARHSARKRIAPLPVLIGAREAAVVDVGYEGLRLQFNVGPLLPEHFVVHIPELNAYVPSHRVWTRTVPESDGRAIWCGAAVDTAALAEWREIVDAADGSPIPDVVVGGA